MSFTGSDDIGPTVRIATVINSLLPSERRVAEMILADLEGIVETTAQELADRASVARSTVVRTCQSLGYRGYPQLRVAIARELAATTATTQAYGASALGQIRAQTDALAATLPQVMSVLTEESVRDAIAILIGARRLLAVANGLSSPLATDLALRLTAIGRPTEVVSDHIGQQIAARHLTADDACIVISGSGANEATLRSSVLAVYNGDAEVGFSFWDARDIVSKDVPDVGQKVVVFALSDEIPNDGVAVSDDLSPELQDKISTALADYSATEEGSAALTSIYSITKLAPADPSTLDVVARAADKLGLQ